MTAPQLIALAALGLYAAWRFVRALREDRIDRRDMTLAQVRVKAGGLDTVTLDALKASLGD